MLLHARLRPLQSAPARWLAAAALVGLAATLNAGFQLLAQGAAPFTLFYPAVIGAALFCGRGPAYASIAAVAALVATFSLSHPGEAWLVDVPARWALGGFLLTTGFMVELTLLAVRYSDRLRRQRTELQTMLELIPVGVAVAHDSRAERISVSANFASVLGLSLEQNASMSGPGAERIPYRCFKDGRELRPDELPMQVACRTGRDVRDFDVDLVYPDGRRLEMMISAAPLFDDQGAVRGCVAAHVDVTKLKSAARTLDEASRQKDEFLAMLAHELRNPMAPIRYAAALLRPDASNAVVAQVRAMIERQAGHMSRLLDDLLDVSRITRNVIELRKAPIDLRGVITAALESARIEIEQRQHEVESALPAQPVWIAGDADRLHQVVLNLVSNAAKYTDRNGRIRIAVDVREGEARVRVSDTGIGLAPEMIPRIFDLFAQVHPGRAGGLGIGLSVVRRLVELHGGRVAVASPGLGQGTEFTVTLPTITAVEPRERGAPDVVPLFRTAPRVLVIDDNRDSADALAAFLRANELSVQVAYDGDQGTRLAEASRPDAVVLDIGLPGMSGYEVAQWIRSRPWGGAVKLVAVTGWGQAEDRARVRAAGFDDHFVKPVDPDVLCTRLREMFPEASAEKSALAVGAGAASAAYAATGQASATDPAPGGDSSRR
jgi:signal transduction histidine kinase/FixJ family two-component response regulator